MMYGLLFSSGILARLKPANPSDVRRRAPHSIIATATLGRGLEKVANKNQNYTLPDRLPALRRMAWAMWTPEEIEAGEPFDQLLRIKPK